MCVCVCAVKIPSTIRKNNLGRYFRKLMYQISPLDANLKLPLILIEMSFRLPIKSLQFNKSNIHQEETGFPEWQFQNIRTVFPTNRSG